MRRECSGEERGREESVGTEKESVGTESVEKESVERGYHVILLVCHLILLVCHVMLLVCHVRESVFRSCQTSDMLCC